MIEEFKKLKSEVSRKRLMQSIASIGLGVGMSEMNFLQANTTVAQKKIIRFVLPGGISHIDSFDPKPDNAEVRGDTKAIRTNTDDQLSEYFPELADRMDKLTLVRSMWSSEADHMRASYLNATSYPNIGTTKHPDLGAWMKKLRGGGLNQELPTSVKIGGSSWGGFLGTDYDPFVVANPKAPLKGLVMEDLKSDENQKLLKLMAKVRTKFHEKNRIKHVESYRSLYNDSIKFLHSKHLEAFEISKEDEATKKKFEIVDGDKLLLGLRLLEANVQYVTIGLGNWDDHFNLWDSFPEKAQNLDKALATFIDEFHARGLHKDTIFNVVSDFGRSPNITGGGRNHHRSSFTWILGGAGVKNGMVYGKTDERGMKPVENPMTPADFNATVAALAGLDLEKEIYSPDNRPFTVARGGKVNKDLIS